MDCVVVSTAMTSLKLESTTSGSGDSGVPSLPLKLMSTVNSFTLAYFAGGDSAGALSSEVGDM